MLSADSVIKFFVLLCIFVTLAASGQSQDLVTAKIVKIQGSVRIARVDSANQMTRFVELAENAPVLVGDVIKTNAGGRVILGLADGSQAIISENTTVEIKDLRNSPRTIFNVLRGKTRIKIEKMGGKPNPYRVTTPTTVIAVRGTVFDVFVKNERTEVYVNEGEVSVINILTPAQEIILAPGQFTRVELSAPPRNPERFRPGRNEDAFRPVADNTDGNRRDRDGKNDGDRDGKDQRRRESENPDGRRRDDFPRFPETRPPQSPGDPNRGSQDRPRRPGIEK